MNIDAPIKKKKMYFDASCCPVIAYLWKLLFTHYSVWLFRFERMLNEMLSHLERQPRNKERRIAWLKYIEPLLNNVGLVLLAHFRRIFPLFLKWMHADDDETVLLVRIISSSFEILYNISQAHQ